MVLYSHAIATTIAWSQQLSMHSHIAVNICPIVEHWMLSQSRCGPLNHDSHRSNHWHLLYGNIEFSTVGRILTSFSYSMWASHFSSIQPHVFHTPCEKPSYIALCKNHMTYVSIHTRIYQLDGYISSIPMAAKD